MIRPHANLRLLMRGVALAMGVGLGLSHLLFPTRYFASLGQTAFDAADPMQVFLANIVGVLVLGLCVGFWIAASDPYRYRVFLGIFILVGALIVPVYLYHLLFTHALRGLEWLVLVGVAGVTYAFWRLYPREGPPQE